MKKIILLFIPALFFVNSCFAQIGEYALYFDGVNDYISVQHSSNLNFTAFTAEAWVCWDGTAGGKILGKTASGSAVPGFNMGVESNKTVTFETYGSWSTYAKGTSDTNHTVTAGAWAHIVMSWSTQEGT